MAVEKEKPYLDDYFKKGMLYAGVLRSQKARARIKEIKVPKLPANCYVLTEKDIPGSKFISIRNNKIPILSSSYVNYEGEAIALVAAPDIYSLEEILGMIEVDYEEDIPYFDNVTDIESRILKQDSVIKGSPDEIFKTAKHVVYGLYSTGPQEHFHSDFLGAIAENTKDGINIITSSEWLFHVRRCVSEVLDVAEKGIKVFSASFSPSYGAKMWFPSLLSAQVAVLSFVSKKTVKLIIPKQDEIKVAPKRTPVFISYKTAVDDAGRYLASEVEIEIQAGAYPTITDEMLNIYIKEAMGVYNCKNISVSGKLFSTNTPPLDIYTNIGLSPVMFASEMQNFEISKRLNLDPYQLKLNNLAKKVDNFYAHGNLFDELAPEDFNFVSKGSDNLDLDRFLSDNLTINKELLDSVCNISDYKRKYTAFSLVSQNPSKSFPTPKRGIGLSIGFQGNEYQDEIASKNFSLHMKMSKNENLEIYTSALPENPQVLFLWKEIAANILKLKMKNIYIVYTNTDLIPDSGRFLYYPKIETINRMIETGAKKIASKRFRDPLPLSINVTRKELGTVDNSLDIFRSFTYGAAVVEVEINPLTSEIETRNVTMSLDAGVIRNKNLSESRLKQSIMESLNWCMIDQSSESLLSRKIYTYRQSKFIPKINLNFVVTENKIEKGIEEIAYSTVPAAFLAAVSQASQAPHFSIPIDPFNTFQEV
ncbi:MAG: molybdopterin-dependent oxidoreductase, partial [Spirochaetales bacterium]|nr:molybdopterin-dependent oxidoreductase [Spirochaetales bacterium]